MQLVTQMVPYSKMYGRDQVTVTAGNRVHIRTGNTGAWTEILDTTAATGKAWKVTLTVEIEETNV